MRCKRLVLLGAGITILIILGVLAVLYVGYCWGELGEDSLLLRYILQCSCPRSWENIRVRKLYSEHAEIMFSACDAVGPVPSPSGQKVAVINYKAPAQSYVWFLQTDERIPFSWLDGDLGWLSDDLLFVRTWYDMNVVDLGTGAEYPITVRTDVRLANGEIDPSVLSALWKARYVILTPRMITAISPDALTYPEHSFAILYHDEFADILDPADSYSEEFERIRQFLRDQDIDYLDYIDRRGTDVLPNAHKRSEPRDIVSPDGRFFYENGIRLVETGEKIVDHIPGWYPIDWVYDGVIIHSTSSDWLIDIPAADVISSIRKYPICFPWLKLRVPAEYDVSGTNPDRN